jgi:hypothetical protein
MGIRILGNDEMACLYESVSNLAFGHVFYRGYDEAALFLAWVKQARPDVRLGALSEVEMGGLHMEWQRARHDFRSCGGCGRTFTLDEVISDGHGEELTDITRCSPACVGVDYDGPPDGDAWSGGFAANH